MADSSAPLEAAYPLWGRAGWNMDWEPMSTTDPPPPAFMAVATGRRTVRAPSTLVSNALRHASNRRS